LSTAGTHHEFKVLAKGLFGRKLLTTLSAWRSGLPKLGSIWYLGAQAQGCVAEQPHKTRSLWIHPGYGKSVLVKFNPKK
jgi:hypothetical protein